MRACCYHKNNAFRWISQNPDRKRTTLGRVGNCLPAYFLFLGRGYSAFCIAYSTSKGSKNKKKNQTNVIINTVAVCLVNIPNHK